MRFDYTPAGSLTEEFVTAGYEKKELGYLIVYKDPFLKLQYEKIRRFTHENLIEIRQNGVSPRVYKISIWLQFDYHYPLQDVNVHKINLIY